MSKEFDIGRIYRNVSKLMKDRGVKVSEMEVAMGVSAGYLSKATKNNMIVGSDVLFRIAQRLGVTVDLLINCDMTVDRATDNLRLMTSFIQKLRSDTDETILRWKAATLDDLSGDYMLDFPCILDMIKLEKNPLCGKVEYYMNGCQTARINIVGNVFYVDMRDTRIFVSHLVEIAPEDAEAGEDVSYYAIDSCRDEVTNPSCTGHPKPICNSKTSPELHAELELLYACLERHAADLQISDELREFIDSYINPTQSA